MRNGIFTPFEPLSKSERGFGNAQSVIRPFSKITDDKERFDVYRRTKGQKDHPVKRFALSTRERIMSVFKANRRFTGSVSGEDISGRIS